MKPISISQPDALKLASSLEAAASLEDQEDRHNTAYLFRLLMSMLRETPEAHTITIESCFSHTDPEA